MKKCLHNGIVYNTLIFLAWTITSFLCHQCGKVFLSSVDIPSIITQDVIISRLIQATILTFSQLSFCYTFVLVDNGLRFDGRQTTMKVCHALATFATNASMALMFASSTFGIKMMEPVTSAIVQYIVIGTALSPMTITSLPFIVGGAIVFAGNPLDVSEKTLGMVSAFLSNLILALRNVAFKQMSKTCRLPPLKPRFRGQRLLLPVSIILMTFSVCLFLENSDIIPTNISTRLVFVSLSGVFHVTYSYVSTALVLTQLSVVSHAVSNIMKRLLVILLLYTFGRRTATNMNFMGLLICTAGLFVYAWDKSRTRIDNVIGDKEEKNRRRKTSDRAVPLAYGIFFLGIFGIATFHSYPYQMISPSSVWREYLDILHQVKHESIELNEPEPFAMTALRRPKYNELLPNLKQFPELMSQTVQQFIVNSRQQYPNHTNFLSEKLSTSNEVIKESQRLHLDIIGKELEGFKYAFLLDIAAFENKGDPCITAGEVYFLARMNIEIIYYCSAPRCNSAKLTKAKELSKNYTVEELVILVHGGGNIVGYATSDLVRFKIIDIFPSHKIMVFPQSIWIRQRNHPHVRRTASYYCCKPNLTIVLRDALSYAIAQKLYNGTTRLLMAPDMAFQIGHVPRFMSPVFDIIWIKRKDGETPGYQLPKTVPKHLKVHISDWWRWVTPPASNTLQKAFYIATNGFFFLQRGRVVITDRLHGHILSVLMDIPHVLIDNKAKKLSSYHNTWTKSLNNTVITDDPSKALNLAIGLLKKYNDSLPPIVPHPNINEDFIRPGIGVPDFALP